MVFWHWQHFASFGSGVRAAFPPESQPFYGPLRLLYERGWLAVDLFFCISGFIFFWLYAERVAARRLSAGEFFLLRFSRLYPLHLLTLGLVAVLQYAFASLTGEGSFAYEYNDVRHFILNLFLLSATGLEKGHSFNGPVWSVSVEAVLYVCFFTLVWWNRARPLLLLCIALLGLVAAEKLYEPLGRGVASFFLGGLTCWLYSTITASRVGTASFATVFAAATAALWISTVVAFYCRITLSDMPVLWHVSALRDYFTVVILFPATVLSLALLESIRRHRFWKRTSALGHLSYSSYLLHFPLQLVFVMVATRQGVTAEFFTHPLSLALFFPALVALSLLSYRFFELPAQQHLRQAWMKPRNRVRSAGANHWASRAEDPGQARPALDTPARHDAT